MRLRISDDEPADDRLVERPAQRPPSAGEGHGRRRGPQFSTRELMLVVTCTVLLCGVVFSIGRMRVLQTEVVRLRAEVGSLAPTSEDEIAAIRMTSDLPLTYRVRVRIPDGQRYRVVYSSIWPKDSAAPKWFGAVGVPEGESVLIVRVLKDPRDERWKITTLRRNDSGTRRMATVLPDDCVDVFLGSHDWLRAGIAAKTQTRPFGSSIRLLDERALVGEGSMMLYGDNAPENDIVGIFAELQPDVGPI